MNVRDADLMGRPEVLMDAGKFGDAVAGRRVMVLGAGGSIGSAVAERAAECGAAHLSLVTNTENHLYQISEKLARSCPGVATSAVLCDIRDRQRLARLVADERPDLVIHAAALKHIPLVEKNPTEGVLTNVMGTVNVLDACHAAKVRRVVFLSTDKAVWPSSIMGATKRVAERICLARWHQGVRVARLVNVIGSSGSVVPLFWSQIEKGIAPTVTDPGMARYFITHREAADFLLHVAGLDVSDEGIFLPKPGAPVNILDLARRMVRASGKDLEPVAAAGIRPGEKLAEDMAYPHEIPGEAGTEYADFIPTGEPSIDVRNLIATAVKGHAPKTTALLKALAPDRPTPGQSASPVSDRPTTSSTRREHRASLRWPKCLTEEDTIARVLAGDSLARFGDGEFKIVLGGRTNTHEGDPALARELGQILLDPPTGMLPAVPPMDPRDEHYENWARHADRFSTVLDLGRVYGSALVGRPKSCPWLLAPEYLALFRSIWKGRKVVGVRPAGHHLEKLLAPTVASLAVVECPPIEAYSKIDELTKECLASGADLAVICAGPAAKALAARLCRAGMQAVDIGRGAGVLLKNGPRE